MNELVSFILYVKSCRLEESWAKLETVQHTHSILGSRDPGLLQQEQKGDLVKLNIKEMMIYCCETRQWQEGRNFTFVS